MNSYSYINNLNKLNYCLKIYYCTITMEKIINSKFSNYINSFKDDIVNKIKVFNDGECSLTDMISYVYSKECITIKKEDLHKRKRIKNNVPFHERCKAVRANNQQCTRRRRDGCKFCGTHIKGTPHGEINEQMESKEPETVKVSIWAEEISGIIHHIDNKGNVYDPQDIYENTQNPKIIAHYKKEGDRYKLLNC